MKNTIRIALVISTTALSIYGQNIPGKGSPASLADVSKTRVKVGMTPPHIGMPTSSAGPLVLIQGQIPKNSKGRQKGSSAIQPVFVYVTPVGLPYELSPSSAAAELSVINDARIGALSGATNESSPTDYVQFGHVIHWQNLVYSQSNALWYGMLNPPVPFNQELGGPLLWWLIDAQAMGTNQISLDDLTLSEVSSDGNVLGTNSYGFTGLSYTPRAIGIRADGSVIASDSASQKCERVLVLVRTPLFDGGDTQTGLMQVENWVDVDNFPYTVTAFGYAGVNMNSSSVAFVSADPLLPVSPTLSISLSGTGTATIGVNNVTFGYSYVLLESDSLPGMWSPVALLDADGPVSVQAADQAGFFCLKVQ